MNSRPSAACRSRSTSAIESAPAVIPATSDITFATGFAPAALAAPRIATCSATSSGRPTCSANATTGTSPASTIRFGLVEGDGDRRCGMRRLHLAGAPSNWLMNP